MTTATTDTTATKPGRKAPARKAPADRKPSRTDIIAETMKEAPAGHELLKSPFKMRSREIGRVQARILGVMERLGFDLNADDDDDFDIEVNAATLEALADLGEVLELAAIDPAAYAEFDTGPGSQERSVELALWYMSALGESGSSAS